VKKNFNESPPGPGQCKDHNNQNGDGCSNNCEMEDGWICLWYDNMSNCVEICGDGKTMTEKPETYCDDGNTKNGDGCNSSCKVEDGYKCSGGDKYNKDE